MPVWTELLGDLETPVAAFAKLVGDEPGFLLESVEHGERWSRFSFVGRNPSATLVLARRRVDDRRRPAARHPDRPGDPRRDRGAARASTRARSFADLPPLHGGVMGYLGYDVIREVERLPERAAPTTTGCPTR